MGARAKLASAKENVAAKIRSLPSRLKYRFLENSLPSQSAFQNIAAINLRAVRNYAPKFYPGRVTVFLGGRVYPGHISELLRGSLTADFPRSPRPNLHGMEAEETELLVVPVVPKDCNVMMTDERFVGALAEQLNAHLNQASAESSRVARDRDPDYPVPAEAGTRQGLIRA
jgi:hypothetical protein